MKQNFEPTSETQPSGGGETVIGGGPYASSEETRSVVVTKTSQAEADAIRKAVEDEVSRQSRWLEFAQKQVDETRKFFHTLLIWTLTGVSLIFGSATLLLYKSMGDLRADLKNQVERDTNEWREKVQSKVRGDLQTRLDQEFDRPSIQKLIDASAQEVVQTRVKVIVRDAVQPLQGTLGEIEERAKTMQLVLSAMADNRDSFNQLVAMSGSNDERGKLAASAVDSIRRSSVHDRHKIIDEVEFASFLKDKPFSEILAFLQDKNPKRRREALLCLGFYRPIEPLSQFRTVLRDILEKETHLSVVSAAVALINWRYRLELELLDSKGAIAWLEKQPAEPVRPR